MKPTKPLTAALAIGLLALSACGTSGGSAPSAGSSASTGPIDIWLSNNEQELAWGKAAVAAWNSEHSDQTVTAQEIPAGKSSEEAITAAITAGTTPCLVYNVAPAAAPQWAKQGGLVDLATFEDGEQYILDRGGENAEQYGDQGKYFMLPWKANPVMVMYNKELFKKAGLDAESPDMDTYDKFLAGSKKIVDSGVKAAIWPSPTSEFYQPWFDFYPLYAAQTGGTQLVEDGKATFNDDNGKAVMDFWRQIYADKLAPQEASTDDAMATENTAMQVAGPWAISSYKDAIDVGFMPIPTKDGIAADETYTFADSKNVSMFTSCKNQQSAWDFLKFSTSEEEDGKLLEATGQMPLRQDLSATYPDYFKASPAYETFADQASRVVDVPNVPNSIEVWQTFRDQYSTSVIFGKESTADALKNAADKIDTLVAS